MIKYVPGGGVDFLKVVRSIGGEKIKTAAHWGPWLKSLDPAERRAEKAHFDAVARKYYEFAFDDYREVGPGRWVPWKVRRDVCGVDCQRALDGGRHGDACAGNARHTLETISGRTDLRVDRLWWRFGGRYLDDDRGLVGT